MAKKIKSHVFNGKKYAIKVLPDNKVGNGNALGTCDPPNVKNKCIEFSKNLPEDEKLRVYIHEAIHCCDFENLTEEFVDKTSTDIAKFLKRIGYVLPKDNLIPAKNHR